MKCCLDSPFGKLTAVLLLFPPPCHPFMIPQNPLSNHRKLTTQNAFFTKQQPPPMSKSGLFAKKKNVDKTTTYDDDDESLNPSSFSIPSPSSSSPLQRRFTSSTHMIHKDVLIIGGGLAGLSTALHLATDPRHPERQVTILERDESTLKGTVSKSTVSGSFAAAGMLAPQSERLPTGPLLDLCLSSRNMYPGFVSLVEGLARQSGKEGKRYLWKNKGENDLNVDGGEKKKGVLENWEVGFQAAGGFLAPAFAGDSVATWAPPQGSGTARWLDEIQVHELEPQLHPDVIGGWWFPEDASVDSRRLTCSLRAACVAAGVHMMFGHETGAKALELSDGKCTGIHLNNGSILSAKAIIIANGAWMRELLPIPITPHKGQSYSLRMPPNQPPILSLVLFAQDTYIVPKADGRIIVGATVEPGSFDPNVTPQGMMHCMSNACALVPSLADLPLEEMWSGLRPTTPDKEPILGRTSFDNLFLAGGYWRNGVLLAPKTGQLLADLVNDDLSEEDEVLLETFSWDRFTSKEGGKKLAVVSRYAASMHPTQQRAKGIGVSAAVGTELGFYSGAGAASEERKRDRAALFGSGDGKGADGDLEDSFENAALMGIDDASVFSYLKADDDDDDSNDNDDESDDKEEVDSEDSTFEDAMGGMQKEKSFEDIMKEVNEQASMIRSLTPNKTAEERKEERDSLLGSDYDSLEAAAQMGIADAAGLTPSDENEESSTEQPPISDDVLGTTSGVSDEDTVDAFTIGSAVEEPSADDGKLSNIYQQIAKNKANASTGVEMGDASPDDRPDFPFRIYHVDKETREKRVVPPYTTPEAFEAMLAAEKAGEKQGNDMESSTNVVSPMEHASEESMLEPDETTFDGYVEIQQANGANTREEELESMRAARMSNRGKASDESKIGAATTNPQREEQDSSSAASDMNSIYDKIKSNKANIASQSNNNVEMGDATPDDRPDLPFRIYHVDKETREKRLVPPYTTPEAFEAMLATEKAGAEKTSDTGADMVATPPLVQSMAPTTTTTVENVSEDSMLEPDETTFDGYVEIQQANGASTREEELQAMRAARMSNRGKASDLFGTSE